MTIIFYKFFKYSFFKYSTLNYFLKLDTTRRQVKMIFKMKCEKNNKKVEIRNTNSDFDKI
jgi:hypothetical protein